LKQFTRTELYSVDKLMRMLLRQRLIFINVRMNEKLTRWPAKDFPRYRDDVLTGAVAKLSRARIVPLISVVNHERFQGTVYDRALDEIGRVGSRVRSASATPTRCSIWLASTTATPRRPRINSASSRPCPRR
jgi:hypothetical protein